MTHDRRSVLSALGLALPFGLPAVATAAPVTAGLRFVPFEEAVRAAFRSADPGPRRVPVGHSEAVRAGLQGCTNDRPFAGFPAGGLRVVRCGTEPGPEVGGVRLYVAVLELACAAGDPGRPFDFASLPPAPVLTGA